MTTARTSANDWTTRKRIEAARAAHVAEHGPACQLCGTVPKTRGLQWDHDHKTGEHRGWLCWKCNRALPTWVTPMWLLQAARYLYRYRFAGKTPHMLDIVLEWEERRGE